MLNTFFWIDILVACFVWVFVMNLHVLMFHLDIMCFLIFLTLLPCVELVHLSRLFKTKPALKARHLVFNMIDKRVIEIELINKLIVT